MDVFKSKLAAAMFTAGVLSAGHADNLHAQDAPADKSGLQEKTEALLQKVNKSDMDLRMAMKQTEIQRLKQDMDESKKDMDSLKKSLDDTAALAKENASNMEKLSLYRKEMEASMQLTAMQMEAEERKSEGLQKLSTAQNDAMEAMNERMAEMDVRSKLRAYEVQLLQQGKPIPGEDNDERGTPDLMQLRKTLASTEVKTMEADRIARETLKAASAKLAMADDASARAKQMAEQMAKGDTEPVAEQISESSPVHKKMAAPGAKADKPMMKHTMRKTGTVTVPAATAAPSPKAGMSKPNMENATSKKVWGEH